MGAILGDFEVLLNECHYVDLSEFSNLLKTRNNTLTVMQWNIRGLLNNFTNLKNILSQAESSGTYTDLIMISETHSSTQKDELAHLNGYNFFSKNRENSSGGGVGIYVRHTFNVTCRDDLTSGYTSFELVILETKIGRKNYLLVEIYRPPSSSIRTFLTEYNQLLKVLNQQKCELVIGGDFNIDLLKIENCIYSREFFECNLDNKILSTISKPTRITHSTATLIDNILISQGLSKHYIPLLITDDSSDHLICYTSIVQHIKRKSETTNFEYRKIDDANTKKLKETLNLVDWSNLYSENDTDLCFERFHTEVQLTLDRVCPTKSITISGKKSIRDPWITPGLLKSSIRLSKEYKSYLKTKDITKFTTYVYHRNLLRKLRRTAKTTFFRSKFAEFNGNSRKVWNLINCVMNKVRNKRQIIEKMHIDGIDTTDPITIANKFADHFATVGSKLSDKLLSNNALLDKSIINAKSIFLKPINENDFVSLCHNLKNKHSAGHDEISNNLLKNICESVSRPMTYLINLSITNGNFPKLMKRAIINPLFKCREKHLITNYRPISLLITLSKILEKVVHSQMVTFLEFNNMFFDCQFGFRMNHDTVTAVDFFCSEIINAHEKRQQTGAIYIDLSKAFDTLDHKIMLRKLSNLGIRGIANDWISSYLKDRTISVQINTISGDNVISSERTVNTGCPQGSILGPFLFTCCINDLPRYLEHCSCICYADDTTVYYSSKDVKEIINKLEEDMSILSKWFNVNKLSMNASKTQFQIFNLGRQKKRN